MYFITISAMIGTNGEKIARQVGATLGYPFYGEEELLKSAEEMGFLAEVQKMDEKGPPLLARLFSEKPKIYLDRLQSVIYELAKKDNAVFFGRGSQLLLKSFGCALHVLVIGGLEKRIERVTAEINGPRELAESIIHRSDREKGDFLRFAFEEDWLDPKLYDVILNTDKLNIESAVKNVVEAAKSEEIRTCGLDSVELLGKLSLSRKVEARLMEAGVMSAALFLVAEKTDSIRLYGIVGSLEEKAQIERIVKGIREVKNIQNDLRVFQGTAT